MNPLDRAISIAVQAHAGQPNKDGSPYILHPLRVMMAMHSDEERIVAILHDVVEDTGVTIDDLKKEGFGDSIFEAIKLLTHEKGVPYDEYIARIKPNELARKVKLADLNDNADLRRMSGTEEKDLKRLKMYYRGWWELRR
jgi:(p)ppGpp synthase/HD superfamily hydrolase